jgi:hypothetical protein
VTVWSSPAGYETQVMSQQLLLQLVFRTSVCPYECTRTARWNGMDAQEENLMIDGVGLVSATISYPGYEENPEYGMWSYARASTDTASFYGLATPIHKSEDLTMDECQVQFVAQRNTAPHAVWLYRNVSTFGVRTGQCIYYLVGSSQLQQGVWRGFYKHASQTTNLAHFTSINIKEIQASLSNANRNVECNGDTSKVCIFWSEFDLDGQTELGCFPNTEGTNVVSPTELLADLRNSNIHYPPPSPPPPYPPDPPPPPTPPPDDFVCSVNSLPDAQFTKDHSHAAPAPPPGTGTADGWVPTSRDSRSVPCWRWDENLLWPPRQTHNDVYESQYQCAGESSLAIQWTTSFRQSRLDERFLQRHNSDTCTTANDGVCDDGGDGDVGRRTNPLTLVGGGIKVATIGTEKCKAPDVSNEVDLTIQEYTVMRIEPQFDSTRLPAVGDRIWLYPDASSGEYQTVSGNNCFDGNPIPDTGSGNYNTWQWGTQKPIGPLEVTFVHNENCDEQADRADGTWSCYCGDQPGWETSDGCAGHDTTEGADSNTYQSGTPVPLNPGSGYPRLTSYFKARNIYDRNCNSVTKTIESNNLCTDLAAGYTNDRVACVPNPVNVNVGGNTHWSQQFCTWPTGSARGDGTGCEESDWLLGYCPSTHPNNCIDLDRIFYQNPNKAVNYHFGNYQCGMRERVLVYGPTGSYCPYGQDRTDCGNRDDVVTYGKSSYEICQISMTTEDTSFNYGAVNRLYPEPYTWGGGDNIAPPGVWSVGGNLFADGECNDRGNSRHLIRTCVFGADAQDCGHKELTLPRSKIPDGEADDSCATAKNGLCEDQLFFSEVAPNDVKLHQLGVCLPNTE